MINKTALAATTTTPAASAHAAANTTVIEIPEIAESKWDEARKFIDASGRFERCKLFAQAMAGMHLRDIQRELGLGRGGDRRGGGSGSNGQIGRLNFATLVEEKMGLGARTATRLMEMGDQLRKRLKKLPELSGVDIDRAAIGELSEPQVKALQAGVRRLTDDRTQQQLLAELGLYKAGQSLAPGGARDGGGGGRSPDEAFKTAKDIAVEDWTALDLMLRGYGDKFLTLQDADVTVQIAALEIALKARQKWLSKPRAQRDPQTLSAWLNGQLTGKATTASEA